MVLFSDGSREGCDMNIFWCVKCGCKTKHERLEPRVYACVRCGNKCDPLKGIQLGNKCDPQLGGGR